MVLDASLLRGMGDIEGADRSFLTKGVALTPDALPPGVSVLAAAAATALHVLVFSPVDGDEEHPPTAPSGSFSRLPVSLGVLDDDNTKGSCSSVLLLSEDLWCWRAGRLSVDFDPPGVSWFSSDHLGNLSGTPSDKSSLI